jgi:hypothetical protein
MSEDPPTSHPPAAERARRRLVVTGVLGAVLVAVVIGGILILRGDPEDQSDYDDAVADRFLAICTADATELGFADPVEFCRCTYDRIVAEIPFARFVEMDAALREDPGAVPDDIALIRTECFVGTAAPPPPTGDSATTTAPPGPPTSAVPPG